MRWSRDVPVDGLVLRQATPADAEDLAALMAEPDVEQWWHQAWEKDRWAEYIAGLVRDPNSLPLTLADNGRAVGYVEVYRVATDILGEHVAHGVEARELSTVAEEPEERHVVAVRLEQRLAPPMEVLVLHPVLARVDEMGVGDRREERGNGP